MSRKQPEPESGTYLPCIDPTVMSNNPPAKPGVFGRWPPKGAFSRPTHTRLHPVPIVRVHVRVRRVRARSEMRSKTFVRARARARERERTRAVREPSNHAYPASSLSHDECRDDTLRRLRAKTAPAASQLIQNELLADREARHAHPSGSSSLIALA